MPPFRLWTPTGEPAPSIAGSGVALGKAVTDMDAKWFNNGAWKVEVYPKSVAGEDIRVDAVASKTVKGASANATLHYTHASTGVKYRGTTDNSLKHTSEVAYSLPLRDGTQRVKVSVGTALDKDTFLPKGDDVTTKVSWQATMPHLTAEAMLKHTPAGAESLNVWLQGEAADDVAYGGMLQYALATSTLRVWEAGLSVRTPAADVGDGSSGAAYTTRLVVRNGRELHAGVLAPPHEFKGVRHQACVAARHDLEAQTTDAAVMAQVEVREGLSVKARVGLALDKASLAVIWTFKGGWKAAASVCGLGTSTPQLGMRFTQGSGPPPL